MLKKMIASLVLVAAMSGVSVTANAGMMHERMMMKHHRMMMHHHRMMMHHGHMMHHGM